METKTKNISFKNDYKDIRFDELQKGVLTDKLRDLLKTNSTVPTHTPKTFFEQFYLYFNGTDTYELYIFINNEWKKINLT